MDIGLPLGEFTCPIRFEMVRPPQPVVKHEQGATYIVQGHVGVVIARHKRAGRIEERDGKLYATQSAGTEQHAAL